MTSTMDFLPQDIENIINDYKKQMEENCEICEDVTCEKFVEDDDEELCKNCKCCYNCCECITCEDCCEAYEDILVNWCSVCECSKCNDCEDTFIKICEEEMCMDCFRKGFSYSIEEYCGMDYYYILDNEKGDWVVKISINYDDEKYIKYNQKVSSHFIIKEYNGCYIYGGDIKDLHTNKIKKIVKQLEQIEYEEDEEEEEEEEEEEDEEEEEEKYDNLNVKELKQKCKERGIKGYSKLKKDELIRLLQKGHNINYLSVKDLKRICKVRGIKRYSKLRKNELIELIENFIKSL